MADKDIKALILKWAARDGEHNVKSALIGKRLSTALVDQLLGQRYPGKVRGANLTVIEDELRKAGMLQDEAG
jgi:hypothetical protein